MRRLTLLASVFFVTMLTIAPCPALEKVPHRFEADREVDWNASGTTCSIWYYNICTGWIWIWSGFADGERLGTSFASCCDVPADMAIDGIYLNYWTGAVAGYGFTGTHAIYLMDSNDCPTGSALSSTPWLPTSGWNLTLFAPTPTPHRFAFVATLRDDQDLGSPVALPSDGPSACGTCFPTTRVSRSYLWGSEASPTCPGIPLHDGDCHVEWLSAAMGTMWCFTAVESSSWGTIKSLYR